MTCDEEAYQECTKECEELKRRGLLDEYEVCLDDCHEKYHQCSNDVCYDNEAYLECEKDCRWLLEKGHGPDYEECVEECYHRYIECDYDEWMGFSDE